MSTPTATHPAFDYHPHIAEFTYHPNMPWLGAQVRAAAARIAAGEHLTDRELDHAMVAAECDNRGADLAAQGRPQPTMRSLREPVPDRHDAGRVRVTGVVKWRGRRSHGVASSIRLQIEQPNGHLLNITWPEDATPVRPGDTVAATVTLTAGRTGVRATRLSDPERVARPHEQYGRRA